MAMKPTWEESMRDRSLPSSPAASSGAMSRGVHSGHNLPCPLRASYASPRSLGTQALPHTGTVGLIV